MGYEDHGTADQRDHERSGRSSRNRAARCCRPLIAGYHPVCPYTRDPTERHVTFKTPGDNVYYQTVSDSRTGAQAGLRTWIADYPAAADYFQWLRCSSFRDLVSRRVGGYEFSPRCGALIDQLWVR